MTLEEAVQIIGQTVENPISDVPTRKIVIAIATVLVRKSLL